MSPLAGFLRSLPNPRGFVALAIPARIGASFCDDNYQAATQKQ